MLRSVFYSVPGAGGVVDTVPTGRLRLSQTPSSQCSPRFGPRFNMVVVGGSVDTDACAVFRNMCMASIAEFRFGSVAISHTDTHHTSHTNPSHNHAATPATPDGWWRC